LVLAGRAKFPTGRAREEETTAVEPTSRSRRATLDGAGGPSSPTGLVVAETRSRGTEPSCASDCCRAVDVSDDIPLFPERFTLTRRSTTMALCRSRLRRRSRGLAWMLRGHRQICMWDSSQTRANAYKKFFEALKTQEEYQTLRPKPLLNGPGQTCALPGTGPA